MGSMPRPTRSPSSAIGAFIDSKAIDTLLEPYVADAGDRAWVVRCMLDTGPAHHRGANFVLLSLIGRVRDKLPPAPGRAPGRTVPIPMRVPERAESEDTAFPLGVPLQAIERLAPAGSRDAEAMLDCLTDGPPQHALANAAMAQLLADILARLDAL
jgi:hypothetical protein